MSTTRFDSKSSLPAGAWPWLVASVWLLTTAFAFWHLVLRDQRPMETAAIGSFDAVARTASAEAWLKSNVEMPAATAGHSLATVVHILRPGCPCNRFTHPHLEKIVARYGSRGVRFIAARRQWPGSDGTDNAQLPRLERLVVARENELSWINASPAALVYDGAGRLVYFGPYSDAARCGTAGAQVERALDLVLAGNSPQLQPFLGGGCFCEWTATTH